MRSPSAKGFAVEDANMGSPPDTSGGNDEATAGVPSASDGTGRGARLDPPQSLWRTKVLDFVAARCAVTEVSNRETLSPVHYTSLTRTAAR